MNDSLGSLWQLKSFQKLHPECVSLEWHDRCRFYWKFELQLICSVCAVNVLFSYHLEKQPSSIMRSDLLTVDLHFGCVIYRSLIDCAHRRPIEVTPLWSDIFIFINIDEGYFDGSDEVMSSKSVSIPHLKNHIFRLIWHPCANFQSLVPFRIQTADNLAVDLIARKLGDDICVNAAGGEVERNQIFCSVYLNVQRIVDKGDFSVSDCIFDCGQLSKKSNTGSLIKAES